MADLAGIGSIISGIGGIGIGIANSVENAQINKKIMSYKKIGKIIKSNYSVKFFNARIMLFSEEFPI